jgi:hypothetical protein
MPTINQLSGISQVSGGDLLPVYVSNNGDARKVSITQLLQYFQQTFASPTVATNLYTPGTGFNITVPTPVSEQQWMLLQPAGALASGTITLPLNTGVPDGTTVLITSTQNITSLTIALNGAAAIYGAIPTFGAGAAVAYRFYQATNSWYRINTLGDAITLGGTTIYLGSSSSTIADDVTFNGVTIGRGQNSEVTNTALGNGVLEDVTTATDCTAVGASALAANTMGARNTAVGSRALIGNLTGVNNIAVGVSALESNLSGISNVAIGRSALFDNTSGASNIAIGTVALANNTSGNQNVAIGLDSLFSNITTSGNIAVGFASLFANTSGTSNIAVGGSSLYNNVSGGNNLALGIDALFANTSGASNVAIGKSALSACISGAGNTTINALNSSGAYAPVFDVTTENNRFVAGSTAVTNAYVQVAWTVVSDARDKTDFAPVPHGLDFVTKLKPTAYRYKANRSDTVGHGPLRYGFKAQDVLELEEANPVIVDVEDAEKLKLNDQSMIAVLVNAIQELKAEFDAYKATHP